MTAVHVALKSWVKTLVHPPAESHSFTSRMSSTANWPPSGPASAGADSSSSCTQTSLLANVSPGVWTAIWSVAAKMRVGAGGSACAGADTAAAEASSRPAATDDTTVLDLAMGIPSQTVMSGLRHACSDDRHRVDHSTD